MGTVFETLLSPPYSAGLLLGVAKGLLGSAKLSLNGTKSFWYIEFQCVKITMELQKISPLGGDIDQQDEVEQSPRLTEARNHRGWNLRDREEVVGLM